MITEWYVKHNPMMMPPDTTMTYLNVKSCDCMLCVNLRALMRDGHNGIITIKLTNHTISRSRLDMMTAHPSLTVRSTLPDPTYGPLHALLGIRLRNNAVARLASAILNSPLHWTLWDHGNFDSAQAILATGCTGASSQILADASSTCLKRQVVIIDDNGLKWFSMSSYSTKASACIETRPGHPHEVRLCTTWNGRSWDPWDHQDHTLLFTLLREIRAEPLPQT